MHDGLHEDRAGSEPYALFRAWFEEAVNAGLPLPEALALATATPDGAPSVRMVLLRGFDERGFVFYTNYLSRKAVELEENPRAALVFHWAELHRQVRIEGTVQRVSETESDDYFATRPYGSRVGAHVSPQSVAIPDRAFLEHRYAELAREYPDLVPRPSYWGGYRVRPDVIEFWQGRENRLHDRICFRRTAEGWTRQRLAP
jgi:pyridoxamine 5'-phosphate oxidase